MGDVGGGRAAVREAGGAELRGAGTARWTARIVIAGALASLAFEQSPANEALRTSVGFGVLDRTHSELVVGAVVAGITVGIEGISSVLIAIGLRDERGVVGRLADRLRARIAERSGEPGEATQAARFRSMITDAGIALGVGAGLVVVRRRLQIGRRSLGADLATAAKATLVVAVVSGLIGVLASGGVEHAAAVGLETPARWFVDFATDWRFWFALLGAIEGVSWTRRVIGRRITQRPVDG